MVIASVLNVVSNIVLFVMAHMDYKEKQINLYHVLSYILLGLLYRLFCGFYWREILSSLMPGCILLAAGFVSNEKIGYGDGLLCIGIGVMYGLEKCSRTICVAMIISSLAAILYKILARCKLANAESELPFIPFICVGLIVTMSVT